jgi:tetratricopeptide (TPR) repeat protein
MPSRPSALRTFAASVHKLVGKAWFHLNRYRPAQRHFERALELKGDDFTAHVYLGRVAYRLGDYSRWQRECGRARQSSPERYARLEHRFELYEPRSAGTAIDQPGGQPAWRMSSAKRPRAYPDSVRTAPDCDPLPRASDAPPGGGDDFVSEDERDRFRTMAPIDARSIARVDLDDLARRLG